MAVKSYCDLPTKALLPLLLAVVASLAHALDVALIPKHALIATMRLDVIADQLRGVCLYPFAHLAGEQVTHQH